MRGKKGVSVPPDGREPVAHNGPAAPSKLQEDDCRVVVHREEGGNRHQVSGTAAVPPAHRESPPGEKTTALPTETKGPCAAHSSVGRSAALATSTVMARPR